MENLRQSIENHRNYSLDLLKFIASYMIVCIHFRSYGVAGEFISVVSRFAVPVFFMISGYYSYNNDEKKIKNKMLKILKIYFGAFILYFLFNVSVMAFNGQFREALWYVSTYLRFEYTSKIIFFNESITAIHLWFLGALIYSYMIQYIITKAKIKGDTVYILSCALILLHLVLGIGFSVLGIETPAFMSKNYILRNFAFMGFPLFTFGHFIRKNEDVILKKTSWGLITLLFVLSVIDSAIVCGIDWARDLYIGAVLSAFALFVTVLKLKDKRYPRGVTSLFKTTTLVYVIHVMVGDILNMTPLAESKAYLCFRPLVIFSLSVIAVLIINIIKNHLKIKQEKRS